MNKPIPVILDTDIGADIDDTWALGLLEKCPELDLKLVVTEMSDPAYKARLTCKLLERTGRADVAVGVGIPAGEQQQWQASWLGDYALSDYPGKVYTDGVGALIDCIKESDEPVTILAIGPVPTLAAALERDPSIAKNARICGMQGSICVGYFDSPEISPECNVVSAIGAWDRVFSAPWQDIRITPLDTCGSIYLEGARWQKLLAHADNPVVGAILENYRHWLVAAKQDFALLENRSSCLYDTVAIYLALAEENLIFERLPIKADDKGFTRIDPARGRQMDCATGWVNKEAYLDFLTERLCGE